MCGNMGDVVVLGPDKPNNDVLNDDGSSHFGSSLKWLRVL